MRLKLREPPLLNRPKGGLKSIEVTRADEEVMMRTLREFEEGRDETHIFFGLQLHYLMRGCGLNTHLSEWTKTAALSLLEDVRAENRNPQPDNPTSVQQRRGVVSGIHFLLRGLGCRIEITGEDEAIMRSALEHSRKPLSTFSLSWDCYEMRRLGIPVNLSANESQAIREDAINHLFGRKGSGVFDVPERVLYALGVGALEYPPEGWEAAVEKLLNKERGMEYNWNQGINLAKTHFLIKQITQNNQKVEDAQMPPIRKYGGNL